MLSPSPISIPLTRNTVTRFLLLLIPAFLTACIARTEIASPADLAITHAAVIDVESGRVLPNQTVLVRGDRTVEVAPSARVRVPAGARAVDATGKYLIPGLWDMHVHAAREGRARHFWPLFLAHGVTGVREMGSYLDSLRHWRAEAERPGSGAPRIVWSSPMLDGVPTSWAHGYGVADAAAARAAVDSMQALGFDFLKVYDRLPRDAYFSVAEEAKRRGIPFAGHVPDAIGIVEASDAGQKSIEHFTMYLPCTPEGPELSAAFWNALTQLGPEADSTRRALGHLRKAALAGPDPGVCRHLYERLVANGTWVTPTLTVLHGWLAPDSLASDARLRFVPPALADRWREARSASSEGEVEFARLIDQQSGRLMELAQHAGVGILAGTDASDESYVFAGSSLHDELALLVQAGLSPLEALRAATLNPAKYLEATDSLGTIAPGKLADLVLLDANPLDDIHNTKRIYAVVASGRLIDAAERERLLRRAEAEALQATIAPPARR
jgi:imidazolonepropionase-like amidohydrolase